MLNRFRGGFARRASTLGFIASIFAILTGGRASAGTPNPPFDWYYEGAPGSSMGACVASAGDVNGDGFTDVIVGSPTYSGAQTMGGRADVFLGGPSGLSAWPAWTRFGDQGLARFGYCVSSAGDINGDGYDEILVSSPDYTNVHSKEGRLEMFLGGPNGPGGTPAWSVESNQSDSGFGLSVAGIGDVNGDGLDDVAIGAPKYDGGVTDEGRVFVYYGDYDGLGNVASVIREVNVADSWFGASVAWAGDVNGDAFDDLVVGAPRWTNGQSGEGAACLFLGSGSGLGGTPAWTKESDAANSYYGASVSGVGDVDGDGYGDVVAGAYLYENGESNEGKVYVYRGRSGGLNTTASWAFESQQASAGFGNSVAPAGDYNGDGHADIAVGAYLFDNGDADEGLVRVYLGGPGGLTGSFIPHDSGQQDARFGTSVCAAGDVNGDGRSDIVVGAPLFDGVQVDMGRLLLYYGRFRLPNLVPSWSWSDTEDADGGYTTRCIFADWNSDGYEDLAFADPNADAHQGRVRVFHGGEDGLASTPSWSVDGSSWYGGFGYSIASAGDVDADGYPDLLIGSPGAAMGGAYAGEGEVWLYRGSPNGLLATADVVLVGEEDCGFGFAVAGAGDLNGDGHADVLVSAPFDASGSDHGRVFVHLGSPDGIAATPSFVVEDPVHGDGNFGWAVAGVGDLNGDGYDDWAAGAPFRAGDGRVDVFRGGATPDGDTDGSLNGPIDDGFFGYAIAGIGDVDADGRSDFAVGAPATHGGYMGTGTVLVYRGVAQGVPIQHWTRFGETIGDRFGSVLTAAGDVDGDGRGDLLVGAPHWDGLDVPFVLKGRAYLYLAPFNANTTHAWRIAGVGAEDRIGSCLAGRGDVNGDGHADLGLAMQASEASPHPEMRVYYGTHPGGADRRVRQLRPDAATPIALRGAASTDGFRLQGSARHPMGREYVSMQIEIETPGTPFDGQDLVQGGWFDTGTPVPGHGSTQVFSEHLWNLPAGTAYHWRLRVRSGSRWAPYSPWLTPSGNDANEMDLRVLEPPTSDAGEAVGTPGLGLTIESANPTREAAVLAFRLPDSSPATVSVFDATGRRVWALANAVRGGGLRREVWDLTGCDGRRVPSGVYFVRLESSQGTRTSRLIVME